MAINGRTVPFAAAAFSHQGRVTCASVRDGLSHTAFVAEISQGSEYDIRGVIWTTTPDGGLYMSRVPPNRFQDLYGLGASGDPLVVPWFCTDEPGLQLPCTS